MDELKLSGKPFDISKAEVWNAWIKVKGNQGAAGVDGQSLTEFEADLKNNLYKIWNRMSSGTYFLVCYGNFGQRIRLFSYAAVTGCW